MKDKELKLNASGYYDEPCYKAVKTIDAPRPGEIWLHNQSGYYMLVVSVVGDVCSTLRLNDQPRNDSIPVMSKTPMYTTPIMLGYCFANLLTQYVKTITDDEFTKVRLAVADALWLEDCQLKADVPHDNISTLEEKVKALEEERDRLFKTAGGAHNELIKMTDERDKAEKERNEAIRETKALKESNNDLCRALEIEHVKCQHYREMYETLLDKVISARGEA